MRRFRRRRPAGQPRVPIPFEEPWVDAPVLGPSVARIGPDRTLLEAPWEMFGCTVANVWPDGRLAGGWARVEWPVEAWLQQPIAPLDLHPGHVLELSVRRGRGRIVCHAIVADINETRMILVHAVSAVDAASIARRAVDVWRSAELAATRDAWREQIARCSPAE